MTLEVRNVSKKYKKNLAVKDVSFTLQPESIYGLLGRNGAGKSTVLNMIAHRIEKNSGEILLDNQPLWTTPEAMSDIYLSSPENWFPIDWKVKKIVKVFQQIYPEFDTEFSEECMKAFGVDEKKKLVELSTGYKSIVKLTLALSVPVSYVFLDEPVLGLDANHRQLFNKKLLEAYARRPRTFVIATHLIEEISYLLEEVIVIRDGVTFQQSSVEEILQHAYLVTGSKAVVSEFIANQTIIHQEEVGNQLQAVIISQQVPQESADFSVRRLTLQEYFIQLTRKEGE